MTTLLLIRHGDNDFLKSHKLPGQLPGIHLNKRGREQATLLAETLKSLPIKAIFSSPLERAVETATPLSIALSLFIQTRKELMDTDVGEWAGLSLTRLTRTKQWKKLQENVSQFQFPKGETIQVVQDRVIRVLQRISATYQKEMVAVVSHADPIRLAAVYYLQTPMSGFQKIIILPGSVTIIQTTPRENKLLASNLIPPFDCKKYFPVP